MKRINIFIVLLFSISHCYSSLTSETPKKESTISFKENKGQVGDQFSNPRPDVLFTGNSGGLVFHLRNNGISYQISRVDKWNTIEDETAQRILHIKATDKIPDQTTIYRLDINWLNSNSSAVVLKENELKGYDNYYNEVCPNGALGVKSYKKVTYQNLYKGIDLKWYEKDGNLKYEYSVAPGVDHKQIQLEINGAETISIDKNGGLLIKTPLGVLSEKAPYVTQEGKVLKAKWSISKNLVSFDIIGVDITKPLIIDPLVRLWGTYLGGTYRDAIYHSHIDALGDLYCAGSTGDIANFATTGVHQTVSSDWGDAFLAKFNSTGGKIWATYYGGVGSEFGYQSASDPSGNYVGLVGGTTSPFSTAIATPGSHQPNFGGGMQWGWPGDAYLVLFNNAGVRQWGTYYGGSGLDWGLGCAFDKSGNVYLTGVTLSTNSIAIASNGSHQPIHGGGEWDGYIAKFNITGTRLWSSYYGGGKREMAWGCVADSLDNIYLIGNSLSTNNISTPGSHQPLYGGGTNLYGDGFIAKFTPNGVRQWATYFGGIGDEWFYNGVISSIGDLYLAGTTFALSGSGIATPGTHQTTFGGGGTDAFLVKFTSGGAKQWCTFFGGPKTEDQAYCAIDPMGSIYLCGVTSSSESISTPCAYKQDLSPGAGDVYLAKFDTFGQRMWGTYYGGTGYEEWPTCTCDALGNVYLVGSTSTTNTSLMTSAGAYQNIYGGGGYDGFIAKFDRCIPLAPLNTTDSSGQVICQGKSTTLTVNPNCDITWFDVPTGGVPIGDTSVFATPDLTTTITFYASEASCGSNTIRTAITVTVNALPNISIDISPSVLCYKTNANAKANGVLSYTWYPDQWISCTNCSDPVLSPLETMTYCVEGMDNNSCVGKACAIVEVNSTGDHDFSLPNALSPNDDGINDSFCLQGWDLCNENFNVKIFDRWGEKVFESEDPNFCWNGIYKEKLLNADVFVYSVKAKYKDGTEVSKKGNITLIR